MDWTTGIPFLTGTGNFSLHHLCVHTSSGSIQLPIQEVPGALYLGVKRLKHDAAHSLSSSAEVKNAWSYKSAPPPLCLHGVVYN